MLIDDIERFRIIEFSLECIGKKRTECIPVEFASLNTESTMGASVVGIFEGDYFASSCLSLCKFKGAFDSFATGVDKIYALQ